MRIGIDGGCLANRRGFGRFARQIAAGAGEAAARGTSSSCSSIARRSTRSTIPERFETIVVEVGRGPEPGGVGARVGGACATCWRWAAPRRGRGST